MSTRKRDKRVAADPSLEVFRMPEAYTQHPFIASVEALLAEDHDDASIEIVTEGLSGQLYPPFVLGLWSPVLKTCISRGIRRRGDSEGGPEGGRIVVDISKDADRKTWALLTSLAIGYDIEVSRRSSTFGIHALDPLMHPPFKQVDAAGNELMQVARVAEYLQMEAIREAVEDRLMGKLTIITCARLLSGAVEGGLLSLQKACRSMALKGFIALVDTHDFPRMPSDVHISLLKDDALQSKKEVLASFSKAIQTRLFLKSYSNSKPT